MGRALVPHVGPDAGDAVRRRFPITIAAHRVRAGDVIKIGKTWRGVEDVRRTAKGWQVCIRSLPEVWKTLPRRVEIK